MGEFVCRSSVSIMLELSWFHFTTIKSSSLKRIHIAINVNECSLIVMSTSLCVCSSRAPHTQRRRAQKKNHTKQTHNRSHIVWWCTLAGRIFFFATLSFVHISLRDVTATKFPRFFLWNRKKNQINTTLVNTLSPSKPKSNGKKVVSLKTHPKYRTQKSTRWIVGN